MLHGFCLALALVALLFVAVIMPVLASRSQARWRRRLADRIRARGPVRVGKEMHTCPRCGTFFGTLEVKP